MKDVNEELEGNTPTWDSNLGRWIEPEESLDTGAESPNESLETDGAEVRTPNGELIVGKGANLLPPLDASHLSQSATDTAELSLDKVESFSQWLDQKGDALAPADSFETWLKEREDSI